MRKRNGHDWGYLVWRCWRAQSKLSSMKWSRFGSCPCWILRCKRTSSSNILKHWDKKCWDGWVLKADAVNVSCARRFNFNKKISEFKQRFWELLLFKRKRLRNDDFSACFRPLQFRLQRFLNTIFFTKFTKLRGSRCAAWKCFHQSNQPHFYSDDCVQVFYKLQFLLTILQPWTDTRQKVKSFS